MLKLCNLFSGSTGNCTFIGTNQVKLLVDAGVCARSIERALREIDEAPEDIDAILVTHEHSDHIKGIGVLARRYGMKIYANSLTWNAMEPVLGEYREDQRVEFSRKEGDFALGDLEVRAFSIPHDAAAPVGYTFSNSVGRGRAAIATDIGHITDDIRDNVLGSDAVLLESNHDPDMLKYGPYPPALQARIRGKRGHLNNFECADLAVELADSGTNSLILGHLSRHNNTPSLAFETVHRTLTQAGVSVLEPADVDEPLLREKGSGISLCVASPDRHSTVVLL